MKTAFFHFVLKAPDRYRSGQKISASQKALKVAIPLSAAILIALTAQLALRYLVLYPVTISDNAMEPTLMKDSRAFFLYMNISQIKKNDIVVVKYPGSLRMNTCRIKATEGERIQIKDKNIIISQIHIGKIQSLDTRIFPAGISSRDNVPLIEIRPGHFYCMNDNADNSTDSRMWGPIPVNAIEGKILPLKWLSPF